MLVLLADVSGADGAAVRFFAFVRFEIAVRQTCPSGQSHQTLRLLPAVTISGVSAPLSVGCHSAAISGSMLARSLKPASTFLFPQELIARKGFFAGLVERQRVEG